MLGVDQRRGGRGGANRRVRRGGRHRCAGEDYLLGGFFYFFYFYYFLRRLAAYDVCAKRRWCLRRGGVGAQVCTLVVGSGRGSWRLGNHIRHGRIFSGPGNPYIWRIYGGRIPCRGGNPPLLQRSLHLSCQGGIPVVQCNITIPRQWALRYGILNMCEHTLHIMTQVHWFHDITYLPLRNANITLLTSELHDDTTIAALCGVRLLILEKHV